MLVVLGVSFLLVSWCFTNRLGRDFYFFFGRFVSIRGLLYFFWNGHAGMVMRAKLSRMGILVHSIFLSIASLMFAALAMYDKAQYDLIIMFSWAVFAIVSSMEFSVVIHSFFHVFPIPFLGGGR